MNALGFDDLPRNAGVARVTFLRGYNTRGLRAILDVRPMRDDSRLYRERRM